MRGEVGGCWRVGAFAAATVEEATGFRANGELLRRAPRSQRPSSLQNTLEHPDSLEPLEHREPLERVQHRLVASSVTGAF